MPRKHDCAQGNDLSKCNDSDNELQIWDDGAHSDGGDVTICGEDGPRRMPAAHIRCLGRSADSGKAVTFTLVDSLNWSSPAWMIADA